MSTAAPAYIIEDGIPLPPVVRRSGPMSGLHGTMRMMTIGQSVLVPWREDISKHSQQNVIGASCRCCRLRYGLRFVTRSNENGVRIWRVE